MTTEQQSLPEQHEPTAWLRSCVLAASLRFDAGDMVLCDHLSRDRTTPAFIAAWDLPDRALCHDCAPADRMQDRDACDRCGRIGWAGVGTTTCLVGEEPARAVTVLVAMCGDCLSLERVDNGLNSTEGRQA